MLRVYYNLHKKMFSVQRKINGRWKVAFHTSSITLKNVTFKVYESGRQRVIKEKRKNVRAYVIGEWTHSLHSCEISVTYNPYKCGSFVIKDTGEPIKTAKYVKLSDKQVLIA